VVITTRKHQLVSSFTQQHAKRITVRLLLSGKSAVRVRCLLTTVGRLPGLSRSKFPFTSIHRPSSPVLARAWFARLERCYKFFTIVGHQPSCLLAWFQASQTFIRRCWSDQTIEFLPDTARPTKFEASPPHASKLSLEISVASTRRPLRFRKNAFEALGDTLKPTRSD
jgi:hypothetical protein